ncbi:cadherin domain protein, partial [Ostertagia ostertagi]
MDVNLKDSYAFRFSSFHLPPPSIHTETATITVAVTDVNNHLPSLIDLPDRLSISENTTVGSIVFTVKASDQDRGDNARLLYRLLSGQATEYLSIDSKSGKIILRKAVDFETIKGFDVEIEVCDHGHPELCIATILPAVIEDSPMTMCHEIRLLRRWCSVVLPRELDPGTVVTTVFAEDRDSSTAGQVHYALLDAITGFSIDSSSGVIQTTEALEAKQYTIRIGATDGYGAMSTKYSSPSTLESTSPLLSINSIGSLYLAKPVPINTDRFFAVLIAHSDEVSITKCVELRVIRDSPAPMFTKKSATLKLKRNIPLGNQLMKVDAGGHFNFSTNCRWLRVDSDGIISVRELIDKSIDSVQCDVEAKDSKGRSDPISSECHLPRAPIERRTARLLRTRKRSNNSVYPSGGVQKRQKSGCWSAIYALPNDRNLCYISRYLNNTYSTMVHVFIDDVNDHCPQCSQRNEFVIEENLGVGTTIGYLEAYDDDRGLNGVMGYRLLDNQNLDQDWNGSGRGILFSCKRYHIIDKTSGKVSRKGRLRPDSRFNISVAAIDEDGQMATALLIVTTSSDDSAPPVFDRMEPFKISSTSLPGSIIGRVKAVAGRHVVKYSITDQKFDVDTWGNVILTADTITSGTHDFVVTASTAFQNATAVQKVIVESVSATVGGRTFRV